MGIGEDTAAAKRDQADIRDPDQSKHNQPPETPRRNIEVATAIAAMAAEESWSMMNLLLLVTMWAAACAPIASR
jgi:hypothetical protein